MIDTQLVTSISNALAWCERQGIDIPLDIALKARQVGAIKADGDITSISADYHSEITAALLTYFEGGSVTGPRNAFRRAAVEALGDGFDIGYTDGGGELPIDGDALDWLNARIEQEMGFVSAVFEQLKALRKEEDFDALAWISERADGYTATLSDLYNQGKLYGAKNKMLTFDGEDGSPDNICQRNNGTCVRLKGKRHKASWWIAHDLIPYRGNPNFDCGAWECQHYLRDDDGNRFTI
jgi:hypothetical protein